VDGTGEATVTGPTAFSVTSTTSGLATLTVDYNFTPVPEPPVLWGYVGFGMVVSGVAFYRKRRMQRQ
jgi:hypothetical protein